MADEIEKSLRQFPATASGFPGPRGNGGAVSGHARDIHPGALDVGDAVG